MNNNNFEFDKVVISIALAIFTVVFSNALGGFFYRTKQIPETRGYQIEIVDASPTDSGPKGLPEVLDMAAILSKAVAEQGKAVFNKCAVCHTHEKGGANKVGPNLWGIVGAVTAHHKDFNYSNAMAKRGQDGIKWTYEELYRYVYSPRTHVVGTKMAFAGIKKDDERANLIAYLGTLADNPVPLPK